MTIANNNYLSAKQIAECLSISPSRAYEVMAQLPHVKFGRNVRVPNAAFRRWLDAHTVQPTWSLAPSRKYYPALPPGRRKKASWISGDGSTIRRMAPRT